MIGLRHASVLIILLAGLVACGGPELTVKQVLEVEGVKIAKAKQTMAQAAKAIPISAAGLVASNAPLSPLPGFDYGALSGNVRFVRIERLTDRHGLLQMDFLSDYRYGSDWMDRLDDGDPAKPRDETALAADGTSLRNSLRGALEVIYVVLMRLKAFEPAVLAGQDSFSGGSGSLDAFLIDLRSGTILVRCDIAAAADQTVEFKYGPDDSQADIEKRMLANAEATLELDAMRKLGACLARETGGTFKLN